MTNKDKFLREGVSVEEFLDKMVKSSSGFENEEIDVNEFGYCIDTEDIKTFLNKEAKPTLTEDERVILRNIKNYQIIQRNEETGELELVNIINSYKHIIDFVEYNHLFQFIKERRRILY